MSRPGRGGGWLSGLSTALWLAGAALPGGGCGDPTSPNTPADATPEADAPGQSDGQGPDGQGPDAQGSGADAPGQSDAQAFGATWAGMAVVCSDYSSTSVALVDPLGLTVTTPTLIHSGSLPPGVMPALGGDVDLPTSPAPDGSVLLMDRTPGAVLTFVDPATGAVQRQLSVGDGFSPNPHDALVAGRAAGPLASVGVPAGSVLVTRYDPNPTPAAPAVPSPSAQDTDAAPLDAGDDLLLLSPAGAPLAALPFTEADGFPGRPDRLVAVAPGTVWVSLNRVSRDWQTYREGAVAVVEAQGGATPTLRLRTRLAAPGLRNCGTLAVAPAGGVDQVALACGGSWQVGTSSFEASESAVVLWDVGDDGGGAERARLEAAALPGDAAGHTFGPGLALLPGGAVVATTYGGPGEAAGGAEGDAAVWWDPSTGQVRTLMTTARPWTLWAAQVTPDAAVLLPVGDDLAPTLCRVGLAGSAPRVSCLDACASTGLPPRAVRPFLALAP